MESCTGDPHFLEGYMEEKDNSVKAVEQAKIKTRSLKPGLTHGQHSLSRACLMHLQLEKNQSTAC